MTTEDQPPLPPLGGQSVDSALDEPRLVSETGVEARVAAIVEPALLDLGYRLVRVRMTGMNGATLQIFAEKADGTMSVEDCETASNVISPLLDVDDPIGKPYTLEMSSPGMDRILVRRSDFVRWSGFEAKLELAVPVHGRKRFRGWLTGVADDKGGLHLLQALEDGTKDIEFPLDGVAEARLVLNEALIREALKAGKS
ncbi:ribosome maturation factor RimP [Pleomorphomonas koreensis]|uniref:ribosome maturation factor RimP n=1 Tax=Pleomorphomonas koreensis TaxID=257440 RepID=UPI0004038F03|nr:ribosome maturation factor RimP [Pleomorphomonas koreensis]